MYPFGWVDQPGDKALWGYCLGPCTGKSYCHWYFCKLQGMILSHPCIFSAEQISQGTIALWGYCRCRITVTGASVNFKAYYFHCKKRFIHVFFWMSSTGKICCHCYNMYFHLKCFPMNGIRQFLSVYCYVLYNFAGLFFFFG